MPKPTKAELTKHRKTLLAQLASLTGDVGSMRDEALRASEQDNSVDHLADQGSDNHDQAFMLGLIENEEETIALIRDALDRIDGSGDYPKAAALHAGALGCSLSGSGPSIFALAEDRDARNIASGMEPGPGRRSGMYRRS